MLVLRRWKSALGKQTYECFEPWENFALSNSMGE